MNRRNLLRALAALPIAGLLAGAARGQAQRSVAPIAKSDDEWREILSPARYEILFENGTEPAHSSPLNHEDRDGTFICAACRLPLFRSEHKYDSGTGWPSFTQPIADAVDTRADYSLIWPRTEYHCARCDGHQGHVFDDGPRPRGERWCNNGLALAFVPAAEPLPALRQ